MNKNEPHFSCAGCADMQSWPADHLRQHGDELWCADCWDNIDIHEWRNSGCPEYSDLPAFVPEADLKIQALTEGLQAIKRHMEIMGAGNLGAAWNIADTALKKTEAVGK